MSFIEKINRTGREKKVSPSPIEELNRTSQREKGIPKSDRGAQSDK